MRTGVEGGGGTLGFGRRLFLSASTKGTCKDCAASGVHSGRTKKARTRLHRNAFIAFRVFCSS